MMIAGSIGWQAQMVADRMLLEQRARKAAPEGDGGGRRLQPRWFSDLHLLANHTAVVSAALRVGGYRVSTTANLIPVNTRGGCAAYLGIGHTHRAEGKMNAKYRCEVCEARCEVREARCEVCEVQV